MSVLVIFNPISGAGRARRLAETVAAAARARGLAVELQPTSPGPASAWLRDPIQDRRALVVVGGDGAVRNAATEAARADVPLVHCPAGNENLFAREFRTTANPDLIATVLERGHHRRIDLVRGLVAGREPETVVLMASFGFDADVVHDLASIRTGTVNNLSYLRPILRRVRAFSPPVVSARLDGEEVADRIPGMVIVANSRQYAARLDPARTAVMDDGLLDLVLVPARTWWELLLWLPRIRFGAHLRHPRLVHATGRRLELVVEPAGRWQADGDPAGDSEAVGEIAFEVDPGALPVLEPPRTARDRAT